jgi:dipeptidyl aminopeptidase/acylaminoacyl peptidase
MKGRIYSAMLLSLALCGPVVGQEKPTAPARRNLEIEDLFRLKTVGRPQVSPEGKWVAYTVATTDLKEEKSETQIWMAPTDGGEPLPMTAKGSSASHPRFSPDNKYLAFLAARAEDAAGEDDAKAQVWLLDRRGGEAQQLTEVMQGVEGFEWSPDGQRLVLLIKDPSPEELEAHKHEQQGTKPARPMTTPPHVIDRLQFKRDYAGYLDRRRTHLYTFHLATKKLVQITSGDFDDYSPAWSPDGRFLAFVSNRTEEPDANFDSNLWVVASDNPDLGKTLVQVTRNPGEDEQPAWSPDGKWIAYITNVEPKLLWYATRHLAVIPAPSPGGSKAEPKLLAQAMDRNAFTPQFAPDSAAVYFMLEDSGEQHLARVAVSGGAIARPIDGPREVESFHVGKTGLVAALVSEPKLPAEVFLLEPGKSAAAGGLRQLTTVNKKLLDELRLADYEEVQFKSPDGTPVEGFIVKPPGFSPELKYPALLRIHGGPTSQYSKTWMFEAQLFAAHGYVVILVNPRGSTGYGQDFCKAIFADWGNKDVQDVLAGVDYAIAQGYVDPERLGVGGWSYGGMMTNYVISQTTRFKAAISGAGGALWTAHWGHDHYQLEYVVELGLPWKNREAWERVSSPFYNVEQITTPALYMGGGVDWNVPVIGSEHMYQSLRALGRTTQLVVYPGEHHGIRKPSYQKDRYERYLAWYGKYVKDEGEKKQGLGTRD